MAVKGYGWNQTDSVSLLSSLLDSTIDVLVSCLNLAAVIYAAKPADDDHRFGHNAIEDIVGLVQASLIAASGAFLLYEAVPKFFSGSVVQEQETGLWVMVVSIVAPLVIVLYQRMVRKKTKSVVLEADSLHYLSDLLMNAVILASIYIAASPSYAWVDPVLGSLIAVYIMYSAFKIGMRSFNHLMDKEVSDEDREKIITAIEMQEGILGYHALKTRYSGSKAFIQLHIDVAGDQNLRQAHEIADALEEKLIGLFHDAEVIVHLDPA